MDGEVSVRGLGPNVYVDDRCPHTGRVSSIYGWLQLGDFTYSRIFLSECRIVAGTAGGTAILESLEGWLIGREKKEQRRKKRPKKVEDSEKECQETKSSAVLLSK
jgi:hypothetical protein